MEVITLKWFSKRYRGYDTRVVESVDFDDLQFVDTHMCKMLVEFTTGESVTLTAMVHRADRSSLVKARALRQAKRVSDRLALVPPRTATSVRQAHHGTTTTPLRRTSSLETPIARRSSHT